MSLSKPKLKRDELTLEQKKDNLLCKKQPKNETNTHRTNVFEKVRFTHTKNYFERFYT